MSCQYRKDITCTISKEQCPWMYFCDKLQAWKENDKAKQECALANVESLPKGTYKVAFERQGYLYVEMGGYAIKIKNPYDEVPLHVKLIKDKSGEYKIKK